MGSAIHILNCSSLPLGSLDAITPTIRDIYSADVITSNLRLDLQRAYDSHRGQYNSTILLSQLLALEIFPGDKTLTLVEVDLFIPVLTFVFGEAQLSGRAAIVSAHRLNNQYYGLPHDDSMLFKRLQKEIIHELGHTFGLYHCRQFECVMRSSTYVEEIDLKQPTPCTSCSAVLRNPSASSVSPAR